MSNNVITLTQTINAYKENKEFLFSDNLSEFFGFFDWFCSDKSLEGRAKKLMGPLVKLVDALSATGNFNSDKYYVIFKNNCPMDGSLYDDFRICDIEADRVAMGIAPHVGYNDPEVSGKASAWVFGKNGDKDGYFDSTKEAIEFIVKNM